MQIRSGTFQMPNPQPWTRWDEIKQRLGNARNMLMLARMALFCDSATFAIIITNSVRNAEDGLIAATMLDGRRIDPENILGDRAGGDA